MIFSKGRYLLVPLAYLLFTVMSYAADNQCATCHEDVVKKFSQTHHSKAWTGTEKTCTSCHGGAEAHMKEPSKDNIITFNTKDPKRKKELAEQCLTCHKTSKHVSMWDMGAHKKNGVSCNDCHKAHVPSQMRKPTSQTCLNCHTEVKTELNKFSHHPVIEGKVGCIDCHDSHGNLNKKQITASSVNQLCYKCHTDKRGPFVWEHTPVDENCLTCHNSHGSSNANLLTQKAPQLCQSCHVAGSGHLQTAYGRERRAGTATHNARMASRSCVNCHNRIHGSNASAGQFGEFFVR